MVDPFLDLASANLIGAATLPEAPAALVADPSAGGFAVSLRDSGEVLRLTAFGARPAVLAGGLSRPGPLLAAADGSI